eukprot:s3717_g5.t1
MLEFLGLVKFLLEQVKFLLEFLEQVKLELVKFLLESLQCRLSLAPMQFPGHEGSKEISHAHRSTILAAQAHSPPTGISAVPASSWLGVPAADEPAAKASSSNEQPLPYTYETAFVEGEDDWQRDVEELQREARERFHALNKQRGCAPSHFEQSLYMIRVSQLKGRAVEEGVARRRAAEAAAAKYGPKAPGGKPGEFPKRPDNSMYPPKPAVSKSPQRILDKIRTWLFLILQFLILQFLILQFLILQFQIVPFLLFHRKRSTGWLYDMGISWTCATCPMAWS